jgi:hypothetical protein
MRMHTRCAYVLLLPLVLVGLLEVAKSVCVINVYICCAYVLLTCLVLVQLMVPIRGSLVLGLARLLVRLEVELAEENQE